MFLFFLFFLAVQNVVLAATNRTIDDTLGDSVTGERPIYSPSEGVWEDATCKGCAIQPDPSLAFDGTWTAATYNPTINTSIELNFKGTAIYVFFILANNVAPGITTETECNFTLDGVIRGNFVHQPDETNFDLQYNQLVFSSENLVNVNHTLIISTSGVDHDVFINFDYANYTVPDELEVTATTPSSSAATASGIVAGATTASSPSTSTSPVSQLSSSPLSSSSTGVIVGIAVAILALLIIIAAGLVYWRRQRRRRIVSYSDNITPSIRQTAFEIDPFPVYPTFTARSSMYPQSTYRVSSQPFRQGGGSSPEYVPSVSESAYHQDTEMSVSQYNRPASLHSNAYAPSVEQGQHSRTMSDIDRPLPPLPPASPSLPQTQNTAALRQVELETEMRRIKQALRELNNEATGRRASLASNRRGEDEDDQVLQQLREQIRAMRSQLEILRQHASSPWAHGLSDVPPPSYSSSPAILG